MINLHGAPSMTSRPAQEPSGELEQDNKPDYGGGVAYWDNRYSNDADSGKVFEWLFDYTSLRGILRDYISPNADVLHVGCGNSNLAVECCKDGHTGDHVNVDNCAYVIETLQVRQGNSWPNLRYVMGDVRCLSEDDFACESFDVVLDKCTFDCIECNPENQKDLEAMLRSIFRVLRPGGVYLLISIGHPESRLCWLDDEPGLHWTVSARRLPIRRRLCDTDEKQPGGDAASNCHELVASEEVMITTNDGWEAQFGDFLEDEHTFVYACRKVDYAGK